MAVSHKYEFMSELLQLVLQAHDGIGGWPIGSVALLPAKILPNVTLIVYSDSSHGAQSQHAEAFLNHTRLFSNGGGK